jgi:hypothetical protein
MMFAGCLEASYWLDPKSPLPHRFTNDPKIRGWKNPRIYYAFYGDKVTADVWAGPINHLRTNGRVLEQGKPYVSNSLLLLMDGVRDRYVTKYNRETGKVTLFVRNGETGKSDAKP